MVDDRPDEDRALERFGAVSRCVHEWTDMYGGFGQDKDNADLALVSFFCKRCLAITVRSYNQSRYKRYSETE
jgi:hypothetical protein